MDNTIKILEKPDWVSWDRIHEVVWAAHEKNREHGIDMAHSSMNGDEIKKMLEPNGKMLVAVQDDKVVGTAAIKEKEASFWFGQDRFAYFCFAAVLPEYNGKGIYQQLCEQRESIARSMGINKLMFNTHSDNQHVIQIAKRSGYKEVKYSCGKDNAWVFMVKWLDGCPYSDGQCEKQYHRQKRNAQLKQTIKRVFKR